MEQCRKYKSVRDYIEQVAPRFERVVPRRRQTLYFIGSRDGPVKIGVTTNVPQRLESLQTGSHLKLEVLATTEGDTWLEREYHRFFAHCRLYGEWFDRARDNLLEQEIRHIRAHG